VNAMSDTERTWLRLLATLLRIRSIDIDSLADLYAISPTELVAWLVSWGVLTPRVP